MATVTTTENTTPTSLTSSSPLPPPVFRRGGSIDIHTSSHLFQRANRLSSRTSNFDVSLDLTLSSGATLSSGISGDTNCQTSFSLNSSASSVGSHRKQWGNYSVKFRAKNFVARRLTPVEAVYKIGDLLGEGGYGEVYRCWHLESGHERAVKVIPKNELVGTDEEVVKEFNILKECDHPNLLKVYECLEDAQHFYIVSEIMTGGELYDELDRCGPLLEEDGKVLMQVLLSCINYCHQRGLVHRDLKPENVLLEQSRDFHQLKIIDFGLAQQVPQPQKGGNNNNMFTEIEGSKYYISPQVLQGNYSSKCDLWALGVIAYIMMGAYAPFDGDSDEEVHQAILAGQFKFDDEVWDDVSAEAKEFIMALLTYEEDARPTAEQMLKHPWLQNMNDDSSRIEHRRRASTRASLNDLQSFHSADSKLKQATCAIIASQLLSKQETEEIDEVFRSLDVSCKGSLSKEDLKRSYHEYFQGDNVSDEELNDLLKQVNFSGSGAIEYSEFVIVQLMEKNMIDNDKLRAAFNFFDKEGKGFISPRNLKEVLQIDDNVRGGDAYVTKKIIAPVTDAGLIDFDSFKNMMFSRNVKRRSSVKRSSIRRSSLKRLALNKQILEELDESVEHDDNNNHAKTPRTRTPTALSPASSRHNRRRQSVTETVLEESEEDSSDEDSETQVDDLFDDDGDGEQQSEEAPLGGKRRKARSLWEDKEQEGVRVDSATAVSSGS